MRSLRTLALLAAVSAPLAWLPAAGAQSTRPAAIASLAQTERMAVDLKQGMTAEEVQKLLGKPRRTALKGAGGSSAAPSQGTLQWTYAWESSDRARLRVEFTPRAHGEWSVASWEWANY